MIKKILLFSLLLLTSCGYQPMYNQINSNFEFYNLELKGNQNLSKKILDNLNVVENSLDNTLNKLTIKSNLSIEETSKNSRGIAESFRSNLNIELLIMKNNEVIDSQNFNESFTYSDKKTRFELLEYQGEIEEVLIKKISARIRLYLNK